jgi:hypothetical protein
MADPRPTDAPAKQDLRRCHPAPGGGNQVRYWHLADLNADVGHVRFWGKADIVDRLSDVHS